MLALLEFWDGIVRVLARNITPAKFTGCRTVQPATIYLHFYRAVYIEIHMYAYIQRGDPAVGCTNS